ncbi:MAG: T9SS type A sorting domain-containing protein [Agriterribacter sp.]
MNNLFISFTLLALIPLSASANVGHEPTERKSVGVSYSHVELSSLSAAVQNDSVLVQWSSFWELNNQYFQLERSSNARVWEVIAVVKGAGSSNNENNYSQVDAEPLRGQSFYRLKQVDADGNSRYSKTISIYYSTNNHARSIYPNSSGGTFVIKNKVHNYRKMDLFSATGDKVIFPYSVTEDGDTKINLNRMPSGVYTLRIYGVLSPSFVKLVKQ